MGVKGFKVDGGAVLYDFNYLENKPNVLSTTYEQKNDQISIAEMASVAKSYYDARGTYGNATFEYGTKKTALDANFDGKQIDCSSFVGLVLRGIPYNKSAYYNGGSYPPTDGSGGEDGSGGDDDSGDDTPADGSSGEVATNNTNANDIEYPWAVNPSIYNYPISTGTTPVPVRTASQLGEWMKSSGCEIQLMKNFSNVEPGDIIFWAKYKRNEDTGEIEYDKKGKPIYKNKYRFMHISHVAMCYSKSNAPDICTYNNQNGLTVNSFNSDTAQAFIENTFGSYIVNNKNNNFLVTKLEISSEDWYIGRRIGTSSKGEAIFGDYVPCSLQNDIGASVTIESGILKPPSFRITLYYWDYNLYPYKHTMMEVSTGTLVVYNRTLEKTYPSEVVLVCRPHLGAVRPDVFAGNVSDLMGITSIEFLHRPGTYYLTSKIVSGLPDGISNGFGYTLDVKVTYTKHGKVYTVEQILRNSRYNNSPIYRRSKYCYSDIPDNISWTTWESFANIPAGGPSGSFLCKKSNSNFDFMWTYQNFYATVNATVDSSGNLKNATSDRTYSEIHSAVNENRNVCVIFHQNLEKYIVPLIKESEADGSLVFGLSFPNILSGTSQIAGYERVFIKINQDNTISGSYIINVS